MEIKHIEKIEKKRKRKEKIIGEKKIKTEEI